MTASSIHCPECGSISPPEAKFCGDCGYNFRTQAGDPRAAPSSGDAKTSKKVRRTVLGMPAASIPGAEGDSAKNSETRGPRRAHTVVGMPSVIPRESFPAERTDASGDGSSPEASASPDSLARPHAPADTDVQATPGRTLPGMPPAQGVAPSEPASPTGRGRARPQRTNRTVLGMTPPVLDPGEKPVTDVRSTASKAALRTDTSSAASAGQAEHEPLVVPVRFGRAGAVAKRVGLGVVALAFVVAAAVAVYRWVRPEPGLRVQVTHTGGRETLVVDVPSANKGTKVRFGGAERTVKAGRVSFTLASDTLQVGDNKLVLDVVDPDGSVDTEQVVLALSFRVRPDLRALKEDPPKLRILVDSLPGADVMVDDTPLELDFRGHAKLDYLLEGEDSSASALDRAIRFRISPPGGKTHTGKIRLRVPYATLQVDRPGDRVVTDRAFVEIAGAVHSSAAVSINGVGLKVTKGRFLKRMKLSRNGPFRFEVVAREPGKAPRKRVLAVKRVASLADEAAKYEIDKSLSYKRVVTNPAIYRGRHAQFVGRVYHVDVHGGASVLQILVRDCGRGQRCPLWVTYPAATEHEVDSWVRVLGEIAGEQQFRSSSGQVVSVPRLDASYVLAAESDET